MLCRLLPLLALTFAAAEPVALYVAPTGADSNPGTAARPFATVERARDAVRALRAANQLAQGATVTLAAGTYYLPATFTLTPADSGRPGAPIVYTAARGAQVTLSGGQPVTGWRVAGGRWQTALPDVAAGKWQFAQLFVDGQRRFRPRLPRQGYHFVSAHLAPSPAAKGQGDDRFVYAAGDFDPAWSNQSDLEVMAFHCWSVSRLRIKSLDPATRAVAFTGRTWHKDMASLGQDTRYLIDNVKEALGGPGEWYLDRPTGVLTYVPRRGEDPGRTTVVAPRLDQIVELRGNDARHEWVEHVVFRGLRFAHGNWVLPAGSRSVPQAESDMAASITTVGARDCVFEDCAITQVGGYALEFGRASKRNRLERCEFTDLGGGGVKIGPNGGADDELIASHNVVRDCLFAHGGRMHPPAVGIWIGYSHHNVVEHNVLADFYYSGISCGWTWGYGATPTRDNLLADNEIYDLPQRVLGDQGGIYTLGTQPGTVIRGNWIHDLEGVPWAVGIYLDEGSSDILVENNLVNRCTTHAFNVNYGHRNTARNNIFGPILDEHAPLLRCGRLEPERSMTLTGNILYWTVGDLADKVWPVANCGLDRNLYWNAAGRPFKIGELDFAAWQQSGQDRASQVADPKFADPRHDDFTLAADSPALKLGFQPFDWRQAGRLTKRGVVKPWPRLWPVATPPPVRPVVRDYEDGTVGAIDSYGHTFEDGPQATARITDEVAADGKQCLKFVDAADQKNFYNPHVFYEAHYSEGTVTGHVDIRVEPGGAFSHEWRGGSPWKSGPAVQINKDGSLQAGGKALMQVPFGVFVRYELTAALGAKANGKWRLVVKVPGVEPRTFNDLPCDPAFKELTWIGLVSIPTWPAVTYVDNLEVGPAK